MKETRQIKMKFPRPFPSDVDHHSWRHRPALDRLVLWAALTSAAFSSTFAGI
jgi:hypothetical protein